MRILSVFILLLLFFNLVLAEQLNFVYTSNLDQQIVKILSVESSSKSVYIHKKYLEQRKSHVDLVRSKRIIYEIEDTALGKTIPLLNIDSEDIHEIGGVTRISDGYLIPVIRDRNLIEIYKYMPSKQAVQRVNLPSKSAKNDGYKQIFAVTTGYITIAISDEFNHIATFNSYSDTTRIQINLDQSAGKVVKVDDVTEMNGRIYIVGSSLNKNKNKSQADIHSVWVCSFDSQFLKDSRECVSLDIENAEFSESKFIVSTHSISSVQVLSWKNIRVPPTVRIFKLEARPRMVWQFDLAEIQSGQRIAIAGICRDEYIFAKESDFRKSIPTNIEFRKINSSGKEKKVWSENITIDAALLNIYLYSTTDHLLYFANFSKTENVRRDGGWYSWFGYSVNELNIRDECN